MKKIQIETTVKRLLADVYTPVGIYLRLRDKFRDTILLESTDNHAAENSYSFIGINAIAGVEVKDTSTMEIKLPNEHPVVVVMAKPTETTEKLNSFLQKFEATTNSEFAKEAAFAQGLYGYTSFESIALFDTIKLSNKQNNQNIALLRYRLYQYVIAFNHFKDELFICENHIPGIESEANLVESLIKNKDVPTYPFSLVGDEKANMDNAFYEQMILKGINSCQRGDVFQIVLSRAFEQQFIGDEFNVYRALRSVNPSPYLFYFDYGNYKLMGSSPESQLLIKNKKAIIHPIAGTCKRTGNDVEDKLATEALVVDEKENAEHVMLVDLARNDLSTICQNVQVNYFKQVHYYSHVIHLVSEVQGELPNNYNPFELLAKTFPAGTLSGAPKYKALQLIDEYEPTKRGFYGGALGFIGFDGSCNHAIMIRSLLSKNNTLHLQAGGGIVNASLPENELKEVENKLGAIRKALSLFEKK
jgi:anthranilate synthase component I